MASKTIKGLTIEIGGDTTKLSKALKDVEAKSRSLSKELGDINKLLKMDPGNADLLAQKHKVLSEAAEAAAQKLDTLKEAERQVQKQFERGEVSEEQLRALQREIVATENKMKGYQKAAKQTAEEVENLGDSADEAGDDLGETGDEAKKSAKKVDEFSDAAEDAEKSGGGMGKALGSAAKVGLAAVAAAATAAITGLIGAAEATREYRTEMGKLDTAFTTSGHSSEAATSTYKALQGVLGDSGQAVEAANHLAKLTDNEKDLENWTHSLTGVYATFGASLPIEGLTEAANETAKVGQVTGPLADALNWAGVSEDAFNESLAACSSEQERQALIMDTLNGLYGDAADKYKETNAEVIRANEANEEWMASMAGVGGAMEPIITDVKLLGASMVSDLVPGVQQAADALRGMMNGDTGAAESFGAALSGILTQIVNKIVEMAPAVVSAGMGLLTSLTTSLISMLPQLVTTGVQLIVSIVTGLASAIPQVVQAIRDTVPLLVQALVDGIPLLIAGAVQLLLAIMDAIPLIIPPLVAALPAIVMAVVEGLLGAIPLLLDGAIQFLTAIIQAIPLIIEALIPQIPTIVTTIINGLIAAIPQLIQGALKLLDAIIQAIPLIIEALIPQIPKIVDSIVTGLLDAFPVLLDGAVQLLMALVDAIPTICWELIKATPQIITAILKGLAALPAKLGELFLSAWKNVTKIWSKAVEFFGSIWNGIKNAFGAVADWFRNIFSKAWQAVKDVFSTGGKIFDGIKDGIVTAFKAVVNAIIRGINKVIAWPLEGLNDILDTIQGISFLGISPFSWLTWRIPIPQIPQLAHGGVLEKGQVGLLEGDGAEAVVPLEKNTEWIARVADQLATFLVDGLQLERGLLQRATSARDAAMTGGGVLGRLDSILAAIERGQIITIDGKALIGATADGYDQALGMRRELIARGAL